VRVRDSARSGYGAIKKENRAAFSPLQIPRVIPKREAIAPMCGLTCESQTVRYHHFQIARVWFCQMREIAKVRSVLMPKPLPAVHQRRIGFWFTAAGSSAENVTGGPAQSARHDSL
jgi:hypothetical protein